MRHARASEPCDRPWRTGQLGAVSPKARIGEHGIAVLASAAQSKLRPVPGSTWGREGSGTAKKKRVARKSTPGEENWDELRALYRFFWGQAGANRLEVVLQPRVRSGQGRA